MSTLPLIPLDDVVVFPGMNLTLAIDAGAEDEVLLVPRTGDEFAAVGTIAAVHDRLELPGGARPTTLEGLRRGVAGAARTDLNGTLRIEVTPHDDPTERDDELRALEREYRAVVEEILELRDADDRIRAFLRSISEPGALADTAGYSPDLSFEQKVELLEDARRPRARLELVRRLPARAPGRAPGPQPDPRRRPVRAPRSSSASTSCASRWTRSARSWARTTHRSPTSTARRSRSPGCRTTSASRPSASSGASSGWATAPASPRCCAPTSSGWSRCPGASAPRSGSIPSTRARCSTPTTPASTTSRSGSPSTSRSASCARSAASSEEGKAAGAILTLIGPPGTGKTSIGESIARATGREFVRMSLGGVRDEAEIRGHRRTYIGALPGRLVRALRDAGTMNPVIMLDEVDKVGADWRGDPSSALLEVLDPAQNHSFRDHYLDVELDLSEVLFIATANVAETIPGPLLDRMEVVGFDGYTTDEKIAIAKGYLWPRQLDRNGLREDEVEIGDAELRTIVTEYTREAGVRNLEREIGKLLRKTATAIAAGSAEAPVELDVDAVRKALGRQRHFQEAAERTAVPGVATGLSVTGAGGDVLFIETTSMDDARGKDEFVLTGQLGDVMKESARIALSYVRGHAEALEIEPDALAGKEFHVHVPAGAIPKDGPSAGDDDDHRARVAAHRSPGQAHGRDDRRGDPPGPGAADRRAQAEGARRPRGGPDRRDPPGAQPRRPRGRPRRGPRGDALPPGDDDRRGPRAGARAGAEPGGSRLAPPCTEVPGPRWSPVSGTFAKEPEDHPPVGAEQAAERRRLRGPAEVGAVEAASSWEANLAASTAAVAWISRRSRSRRGSHAITAASARSFCGSQPPVAADHEQRELGGDQRRSEQRPAALPGRCG